MAISRSLIASILLSLLVLDLRLADSNRMVNPNEGQSPAASPAPSSIVPKIDCDEACDVRCHLSSRINLCKRACGTCCQRCHCVPPGTYGHYDVCPCYGNMTTHGGRHKCP